MIHRNGVLLKQTSICLFSNNQNFRWWVEHGFITHKYPSFILHAAHPKSSSLIGQRGFDTPGNEDGHFSPGRGNVGFVDLMQRTVDKWKALLSSFYILQYSKAPNSLSHTNIDKYVSISCILSSSFIHFNTKQTKTMYSTHILYIIYYII